MVTPRTTESAELFLLNGHSECNALTGTVQARVLDTCAERASDESHDTRRLLAVPHPGFYCNCLRAGQWRSGNAEQQRTQEREQKSALTPYADAVLRD